MNQNSSLDICKIDVLISLTGKSVIWKLKSNIVGVFHNKVYGLTDFGRIKQSLKRNYVR